ncbi:MAG: ribonuclease T [Pseudomonadota bacterium]
MSTQSKRLNQRFRGYFPVIIDIETAGFNASTDAILEIAAITVKYQEDHLVVDQCFHEHVTPFEGANIEQAAIDFNGIDPFCALRAAKDENEVLRNLCKFVRRAQKAAECQRSVIVAHNASFDHGFVSQGILRNSVKRSPFHPFVTFDTTSMCALTLGQTVLLRACQAANIEFDSKAAHSALYDAQKTAELFCYMVNHYHNLGGI